MSDERTRHEHVLARIARGERIEAQDEMSATYRDSLVHLMTMQADSELAGAYGYVPWIMKAPGVEEKLRRRPDRQGRDPSRRRDVRPAQELGVDVGPTWVTTTRASRGGSTTGADIGTPRAAETSGSTSSTTRSTPGTTS